MESNLLIRTNPLKLQLFLRKMGSNYFREGLYYLKSLEYPLVINELRLHPNDKVLDIGPGKSFLPLYLISLGLEVWVVDSGEFYPDFAQFYSEMVEKIFPDKRNLLRIISGDFLNAHFPLNYYDRIYAISTLEHFENQDDIKAILRINQLLKPDGIFVCSLPFSQSGTKERLIKNKDFSYFQRDYELNCVYKRIIERSNLNLRYFIVLGERNPTLARFLFSKPPFSKLSSIWTVFLTKILWQVYYKGRAKKLKQFKYPGVIIVILEK